MLKRWLTVSLYLYIFLLPLQTRWIYQPAFLNGQYFEYGTFSLYATEILLGVIILLTIIHLLPRMRHQEISASINQKRKTILLISCFVILLISCLAATNQQLAFYKFNLLVMAAALFCAILIIKPDYKKMYWAFIASAFVQSLFAFQQFIQQHVFANKWLGMANQAPAIIGVPVVESGGVRWLRTFGTLPHPNMLAGFLTISLFLIIGLYSSANKKTRALLTGIFIVNFSALLTAFSRAAILTFAVVIILMLILSWKNIIHRKIFARFAILSLLIFVLFFAAYPGLIKSRTIGDSSAKNNSNVSRVEQYSEFWNIYKNNWVLGVGLSNYSTALYQLNPSEPTYSLQPIHNTFLLIVAELGLAGVLLISLYLYLILTLFKRAIYNPNQRINPNAPNYLTSLACLTCLAGLALLDHYFWSFYFGIMLTCIILSLPLTKINENL